MIGVTLNGADIVSIIGALSTAICAICTVLNARYAQQHKAATADGAQMVQRVSDEVVSLSGRIDTAAATKEKENA